MIFAELHGKLGTDYSLAHERAEDVLTSTVFGLLRYAPLIEGLLAVLQRARRVRAAAGAITLETDSGWLPLDSVTEVTTDFWPYWTGYGQPDVVLSLRGPDGRPLAAVVVEAKLHAPKSGQAGVGDGAVAQEDLPDPDQLVRYWQGLCALPDVRRGAHPHIIYLTKHGTPPMRELEESFRRAPAMSLAWLSWRDIWAAADGIGRHCLPAADLARLLAHKGLKYFNGFRAHPWYAPRQSGFWTRSPWFVARRPWSREGNILRFWREDGADG